MEIKRLISDKGGHYFFGYYNISPWNKLMNKILCCKTNFIDRQPEKKDILEIGLIKKGKFEKIAETRAWNWQQGCMLQWMPDSNEEIIYNDRINGRFVSIIYNIRTNNKRIVRFPVYSLHPKGRYAISLNFSRLYNIRRAYGYNGVKDKYSNEKIPSKDGIYLIDLKTGHAKLIISIDKLSMIFPQDSMNFGKHWVNHLSFSPSGERFCFFYRWEIPGGLFNTRLMTADISGKDVFLFSKGGHFSHIDWINETELFGWGAVSNTITKIKGDRKKSNIILKYILPLYRKLIPKKIRNKIFPQSYLIFKDKTKVIKKMPIYHEDGHSSISPNKRFIITDTYPNKKQNRKLILYDLKHEKTKILGNFYSIPDKKFSKNPDFGNSGERSDLHPKWKPDSSSVCIDSVHEGFRGVYEIKL